MKRRKTGRKTAKVRIKALRHSAPKAVRIGEGVAEDTAAARAVRERDEALQQQAATAEILKLISSSPADAQPVFDAIVQSGLKIFPDAAIFIALPDGDKLRAAAFAEADPIRAKAWARRWPIPITREYFHGVAFLDQKILDIPDGREAPPELAVGAKNFLPSGYRAVTVMPMMRGRTAIGTLSVVRLAPGKLSKRQVTALRTYAAQAVIAIENVRLFNETREALERQTATSEVLQVISKSPGELEPVFEAMLENAVRICGAKFGAMYRYEKNAFRVVALHGAAPASFVEARRRHPVVVVIPGTALGRLAETRKAVQIADVQAEPAYRGSQAHKIGVETGGLRTVLSVPMLKDGTLIGAFNLFRQEVRAFTDKQVELVTNFAAQAVIAIENARLLNELRQRTDDLTESLEYQTATGDILRVISSSPTDVEPVFNAIAESAVKLCDGQFSFVVRFDGDFMHYGACHGLDKKGLEAFKRAAGKPADQETAAGRAILTGAIVQIPDVQQDRNYRTGAAVAKAVAYRSIMGVPLLHEGQPIGAIAVARAAAGSFSEREVALLKTFANQAVIAIENVRLFDEVQMRTDELTESLQQQTATSEVLQVISSSPGELEPVFKAMLENAVQICAAKFGSLILLEEDSYRRAALYNAPKAFAEQQAKNPVLPLAKSPVLTRVTRTKRVIQIADMLAEHPEEAIAKFGRARTVLCVPMLRDDRAVGVFSIYRQEVRPFTEKQIELIKNFAAQAVIAIENARLLNELRQRTNDLSESLEQQTATSSVLKVISSTPGELEPVFQAILENATQICEAKFGVLFRTEGDGLRCVAMHGAPEAYAEERRRNPVIRPDPPTLLGHAVATKRPAQIADIREETQSSQMPSGHTGAYIAKLAGARTVLAVPMLKDDELIGIIIIFRQEVRPFTDKQIELVKNFAAQAVIAIENARLLNELRESLEQQTATSDVLGVISASQGELQPVFDAMVASATQICGAEFGLLYRSEGESFRTVALYGVPAKFAEDRRLNPMLRPSPGTALGQVVAARQFVQIADVSAEPAYQNDPLRRASFLQLAGAKTVLCVPMVKNNEVVGAISIYRQEVRPFTDKQIALLANFAAQAVIAIENARLLNELRQRTDDLSESLEQQTATSQVLGAISSSVTDAQPVFDMIADSAAKLCEAQFCFVYKFDGQLLHFVAHHSVAPEVLEMNRRNYPAPPNQVSVASRAILEGRVVQIPDVNADPQYGLSAMAKVAGYRSAVGVPIMRDGVSIGAIAVTRAQTGLLPDRQVELLKTFADQAVIAIENARLFDEVQTRTRDLSESLEQQTATSNVLEVISRSAFDLKPVFETVVESAVKVCGADKAFIFRFDGELLHMAAAFNAPPEFQEWVAQNPIRPGRHSGSARAALERRTIHIHDVQADPEYSYGAKIVETIRTILGVPILLGDALLGVIMIYRLEVNPFTDKQIALVETFADQAAIAIENTRLFETLQQRTTDLTESLQQQTATADVLKAISDSTTDLQPVFDSIASRSVGLCGAAYGIVYRFDGEFISLVAHHNLEQAALEALARIWPMRPDPERTLMGRVIVGRSILHVPDVAAEPRYTVANAQQEALGIRSFLGVPMLRDGNPIGAIALYRHEAALFSERQIELVKAFADQAVIAIENTRLLSELRESLEQQTATSEVLKVISSSPGDLEPVFQAMLENAVRICDASFGMLYRNDGGLMKAEAMVGVPPQFAEFWRRGPQRPGPRSAFARTIETRQIVHIADVKIEPAYVEGEPVFVAAVNLGGFRTLLNVPMLKENEVIGTIAIYRPEVRPFSDKEVELVSNFAAQAVIAIENTRLLSELRESLQQQTATADVLKVISSSPGDPEPVFQAMLEKAVQLCEAKFGIMFRFADGVFRAASWLGNPPVHIIEQPHVVSENPHNLLTRIVATKQAAYSSDLTKERAYIEGNARYRAIVETVGARSLLVVPMLKSDELIGAIVIYWQEARSFTDKQMELISNFAAQAVIAIDNARLLSELRESLQQQTATADVLKVISRSTFDLGTVLQTLVESASRLCDADKTSITRQKDGVFFRAEAFGFSAEFMDYVRDTPIKPDRGSAFGRALLEKRAVHIPDVKADPEYTLAEGQKLGDYRTVLAVPMLREGMVTGVLTLTRSEVRPFSEKQIDLATTFADQAAIAIENVRLFESVETRTRELAASLEDLRTAQDRLVQTQKLASLGQLTAGIAHEIKNPLNFVNNFSAISTELIDELQDTLKGIALDGKRRAEVDELTTTLRGNLDKVVQHGKRADGIVKNMLLHSREGSGEHRLVDVNALVEESLNLAYHGARAEKQGFNITLERSFDASVGEADLFPQDITRVLLNLIVNGFYAATKRKAEAGGNGYEPTLTAATRSLGDSVEIRIRDNGTGIPPDVKEKIFNPFFTTKPAGEGTGLGLSLSHDIVVKQHGGSIEVDTRPGEFTEFRVILPRAGAALAKPE